MQSSSYSAMTIWPALSPHAGHSGSRCTLKVRKRLLEGVVGEQAADERVAQAEQELDGLHGLDASR